MAAYPLLAGIIYTSVLAKEADLYTAYATIAALSTPILFFVEGATTPGDGTLVNAIWVTDTNTAGIAPQTFQPNCELRFVGVSTDFTSANTALITGKDCKNINVYATTFGTHDLTYEQTVATYL